MEERFVTGDQFGHARGWVVFDRRDIQAVQHAYENVRVTLKNGQSYLIPKHRGGERLLNERY